MSLRFNPRKRDEKGTGKIHLGGAEEEQAKPAAGTLKKAWVKYAAIGSAVTVIGLAGIFALSSGGDNNAPQTNTPPPVVIVQPEPGNPPVVTQPEPGNAALVAASIQAKKSLIYQDSDDALYSAYIGYDGREGSGSQDFAAHVGLFNTGGISILFTTGEHAGTRIGFFPLTDSGQSVITYEKLGEEVLAADGKTKIFRALPEAERIARAVPMAKPVTPGSGAFLPGGAPRFEKLVSQNGQSAVAFAVRGSTTRDDVFEIELWNGDVYTINLETGDYSVDSVFLNYPDWKPGVQVDRNSFEVVKGRIDVDPALQHNAAPSPQPR